MDENIAIVKQRRNPINDNILFRNGLRVNFGRQLLNYVIYRKE